MTRVGVGRRTAGATAVAGTLQLTAEFRNRPRVSSVGPLGLTERAGELVRMPTSVEVGLDLKVISLQGTWEPSIVERHAAWDLYVELMTRVSVVPLDVGTLGETLTSFHSLFDACREILRKYGPEVAEPKPAGQYSFGFLTVSILNFAVRPVLSRWRPEWSAWETSRSPELSVVEHERHWPREPEFRRQLEQVRVLLIEYAVLLGNVGGVPDLRNAIHPT